MNLPIKKVSTSVFIYEKKVCGLMKIFCVEFRYVLDRVIWVSIVSFDFFGLSIKSESRLGIFLTVHCLLNICILFLCVLVEITNVSLPGSRCHR